MNDDKQIKISTDAKTKRDFKSTLAIQEQTQTGVILLMVDAYIKDPVATTKALEKLKK